MASDNLGDARFDATLDSSQVPAQAQKLEAEVKEAARKIEEAAKIKLQVQTDQDLVQRQAGRPGLAAKQAAIFAAEDAAAIREFAEVANIADESAQRMAASAGKASVATASVGPSAESAIPPVAALVGAAGLLFRGLDELQKGIKGFNDAAAVMADELAAIEARFTSIGAVKLDAVTAQREQVEKTAQAELRALEIAERDKGLREEIIGLFFDGEEVQNKTLAIENNRAAAHRRIAENAAQALKDAKDAEKAAIGASLAEEKQARERDITNQKRAEELKAEEKKLEVIKEQAELQAKMAKDAAEAAKKTAEQFARAFESAFDRIRQAQASAFNANDIAIQISQLSGQVSTLISAVRDGGSR